MYRRHWYRGGWGGGGWGGGWGGGPFYGPRRFGPPLLGGGGNMLMDSLLAGGVGYLMGSQVQKSNQQPQQYQQPAPQYQQYQQPAQQYPQYQQPAQQGAPADNRLAQLKQLGQLRASGVVSDAEFESEKQKILNGY